MTDQLMITVYARRPTRSKILNATTRSAPTTTAAQHARQLVAIVHEYITAGVAMTKT